MIWCALNQWQCILTMLRCEVPSGHLARNADGYRATYGLGLQGNKEGRGKRAAIGTELGSSMEHHSDARCTVEAWRRSKSSIYFSEYWAFEMDESRDRSDPKGFRILSVPVCSHSESNVQQYDIRVQIKNVQRISLLAHDQRPSTDLYIRVFHLQRGHSRGVMGEMQLEPKYHQFGHCWKTEHHCINLHAGQSAGERWAATIVRRTYSE